MGLETGQPISLLDSQYLKLDQTTPQTTVGTFNFPIIQEGGVGLASKYLGILAQASDSAKLGGQLPAYYATAASLANYLPLAGGTMLGTLGSRTIYPSTDSTYDLGDATHYFANGYTDKIFFHPTSTAYITGLETLAAGIGSLSAAGTLNMKGQVAILPADTHLNTDSGGGYYGLWVERSSNKATFSGGSGVVDFAAISGRLGVADLNSGYGTTIAALSFNPYIMKDYSVSPAGTFYMSNIGCLMQGSQSWFTNARLRNATAFKGQGLANGFLSTMSVAEYGASFYGQAGAGTFYGTTLYSPNDFIFYAEKPVSSVKNWQFYGAGTGAGTGLFLGGELNFLQLIIDVPNNVYPSASHTWTLGANWAYSSAAFLHTAGSTANLTLANANLTASSIKSGYTYSVTFKITGRTAGSVTPKLGTATGIIYPDGTLAYATTDQSWNARIVANANDSNLIFTPSSDFNGTISQVSVVQITGFNHTRVFASAASVLDLAVDVSGTETTIAQAIATGLKANVNFISSDGSAGLTATITTAPVTSGGATGSMTFKNGILTAQSQAT